MPSTLQLIRCSSHTQWHALSTNKLTIQDGAVLGAPTALLIVQLSQSVTRELVPITQDDIVFDYLLWITQSSWSGTLILSLIMRCVKPIVFSDSFSLWLIVVMLMI